MKTTFTFLAALTLALAPVATLVAAENPKPNIVIILADDLGYGDIGCYGATKIKTPHIDRLAREGLKFTDAHTAASVCSPSRYGLMTGQSPWRLHKKGNGYSLAPGRMTMASLLKAHGYQSAAIGKWHLGYSKDWNRLPITGPLEVGFDYHFGVPQNHNDSTRCFIENHDIVGRKPGEEFRIVKGKDFPEGLAQPRVDDQVGITLTTKAVGFIRANAARPFFLYFTPCIPHTHVAPAAEFRGTSQAGLLGDALQELDAHVGTILRTLDELKLTDNTLIVFTSDNGGTPKDFKGTQDAKLNLASEAGGIREKFMTAKGDAKALGHVTNGKWHDGKGSPFEGGHRVPFIARWPGRIPPATSSDYTLCLTDLLATAADILAVKLPDHAGEDSFSLLPVLLGKATATPLRKAIFVQGDTDDNAIAICSGRWKAIESTNSKNEKVHQLYDLTKDPSETTDVAREHPEIVKRLAANLQTARRDGRTRK
jgi:arylsulfatase A